MNFDDYQLSAWSTALPSARTTQYLVPGIGGEVGELQSLFAKSLRDGKDLDTAAMTKELGDVLWFVATLAFFYGIPLSRVAEMNIEKLESRKQRGVITGSGDNR